MKRQLLAMALLFSAVAFAQKTEIKEIEKALKSGNFVAAQTAATNAASIMEGADAKTKAKYYFLKGKAFLGNGSGANVKNVQKASASFKKSNELSNNKYKGESSKLMAETAGKMQENAMKAYSSQQYGKAAKQFQSIYDLNQDLDFLYSASQTYIAAKDYKGALECLLILDEKKYTGEVEELIATDKSTGEVKVYRDKLERTIDLKAGTHVNPKTRKTPSQRSKILGTIVDIYLELKDNEGAVKAINKAKAEDPKNVNLILNEANIYYAQGDNDKFKSTLMKAAELDPNNADVMFNIAVVSSDTGDTETAAKYYEKAISLDPKNSGAYINLSVMYLGKADELSKLMRDLGSTPEDDKKYDQYMEERKALRMKALPYLEKASALEGDKDPNILTTLFNVYARLKMHDKKAAVDQKLKALGQ